MTMQKKLRSLFALLAAAVCFAAVSGTAQALETLDPDRSCSLTLSCAYDGAPIEGMALRLYRTADVSARGKYTLTPSYAGSGAALDALHTAAETKAAAAALKTHIDRNALVPDAEAVSGPDGSAAFPALRPGLYLLRIEPLRTDAGRYTCETALVALPGTNGDGGWDYERTVYPKLSFGPNPGDLLSTGMLQWPVPALAFAGVVLLGIGLVLIRRKNDTA